MSTNTNRIPSNCENCGKQLYRSRLGNQCLHCGHRTESLSTQFAQRGAQFLIGNSLLWSTILFEVFRIDTAAAVMITAGTGFCLFGGLMLRRWLSVKGDWIAVVVTALVAFLVLNTVGQG